jgi:hypothetical protein
MISRAIGIFVFSGKQNQPLVASKTINCDKSLYPDEAACDRARKYWK